MPKVKRVNTIDNSTLFTIIAATNEFLSAAKKELLEVSDAENGPDYTDLARIIDETIRTNALQPKIHSLIRFSTCLSVEALRVKKYPTQQEALKKLNYEVGEFVLKLITDF